MPDGKPVDSSRPLSPYAAAEQINTLVNPSVLIVGAGIGGITLALDLDEKGLTNWLLIDREDDVGGTWYVNRYPGCRCDVPAVAYSHSRFQNPNWTETHPEASEIQQYWKKIVKTQGLENRLRLSHDFVKADWDAKQNLYHVTLRDNVNDKDIHLDTQVLVCATGAFSEPRRIEVKGESDFTGRVIHAARWPKDLPVKDLKGKNVVVVGNGCSGVQIVGTLGLDPEINLVSLARGKQWYMPSVTGGMKAARNSAPNSEKLRALRKRLPMLQWLHRLIMLMVMDSHYYWQQEKEGAKARKRLEKSIGNWMVSRAPEHLKDKIVPDFPFMAKRYIFEDGYFAAINSPNCEAVYGRFESLTPNAVKVDDGSEIPADVVVLSTGYDAEHIDMEVSGETDSTKNYNGKADLTYYHGLALPGMPNYFTIMGNNYLINHSSVTLVLEIQAAYITKMIEAMRDSRIPKLEVKKEAAVKYDQWIERKLQGTTWVRVNNYWRKEGSGRIFTHYPGSIFTMWWQNAWPVWADYKGAEKLAVRQRLRKAVLTVALLISFVWGGQQLYRRGVVELLATGAHDLLTAVYKVGQTTANRLSSIAR